MNCPRILLLASVLLGACVEISPTLDFRRLQTEFDNASRSDRIYPGGLSAAPSGYQNVIRSLPKIGIAKLEPKARPTAWMMVAVSQWRTGSFASASESSASGLAAGPVPHSRDQILLTLVPALVIDAQAMSEWKAAGAACSAGQYASIEQSYLRAMKSFNAAQAAEDSSTAESVRSFCAYTKWLALFNWRTIVETLKGGHDVSEQANNSIRQHFNGQSLFDVANEVRKTVPAGDPLRTIMDARMGNPP